MGLLPSSRKLNHPVWGSEPFDFPTSGPFCPAGGRRSRSDRLLRSSLHGQSLQQALTILGGSASVAESTVRTTLPKVDKVDASSVEAPTA
jgi:hypothetical protein